MASWARLHLLLCVWPLAAQTTDVHAILASRCRVCHTGAAAQAGLKMDAREDLLRGGQNGPAIIAGKSGESLLVAKVEGKAGQRMPPAGPPLSPDAIAAIRKWIDDGAAWHAAKPSPPDRLAPFAPRVPEVPGGAAPNPADRFLPAAGALVSDAVFARRAYFDLHGLPPTPEQSAAFERDTSPDKRGRLIDRLLSERTQYAEHWISFWNDLLRNDEGVVYHGERKSITDWLLASLRENRPYDAMVRALLNPVAKTDPDGYLVGMTWRGVISASQTPPMQAAQNAAQVFLGINLKCAACHDSFVNRWKLADTFGLAAMFSDDRLEMVRCDVPTGKTAVAKFPVPDLPVKFEASLASRRAAAAEWFTMKDNGRFARTIVNRYWRQLFGYGLIEPVDDMDAPSWNQDLLDWLASDFAAHGYDLQHLLKRIMTSQAYQRPAVLRQGPAKSYVFAGPELRRLTAEQFQDTISLVSGDWRVRAPRNETYATSTREWRLKSDPLSRALGRPIRDQVYTERASSATTLQALELTNGPLLAKRLERAALALLGKLPPPPANRFDSKLMDSGGVAVDIDITGAKELHLMLEDVDSYDPARIVAGWADAELIGPSGATPVPDLASVKTPSTRVIDLAGKGYTRFRARAFIDEASRKSDISPAVRFFVFTEKPDPERLVRLEPPPSGHGVPADLTGHLYRHLLSRPPTTEERRLADPLTKSAAGLEDLLWALLMSPEFQYIH
ncbi:MAG: DUF1553 domain-containing protein [Bryobacteraceae bacterium]|nr:DUF1553 domain-containing protein [Bryobacteraceae bacterium]